MTTREYARQMVAEFYDGRLADEFATEYAMLSQPDRDSFNALVESETDRLHALIVQATEAWQLDAEEFEASEISVSESGESPDPNWMNP